MSKYDHAGRAALLSLIPGLGHIYEGQNRKGILFLVVGAINFLLFLVIVLNDQMILNMTQLGAAYHIEPNDQLIEVLKQVTFGSTVSIMFGGMFLSFLAYTIQDAYDQASFTKRRRIYPEHIWEMPEATSSSYIIHFALMASCFILAMFFLVPPKPKQQVTDIMFIENFKKEKPVKTITHIQSTNASKPSGKHNPNKEIAKAGSSASAPSKPQKKVMPIAKPNLPVYAAHAPQPASRTVMLTSAPLPAQPQLAQKASVPVPTLSQHLASTPPTPISRVGQNSQFVTAPEARQVNLAPENMGTSTNFARSNAGNVNSHAPQSTSPIASANSFGQGNLPMPKSSTNFGSNGGGTTTAPQPMRANTGGPTNGNGFVPIAPSLPLPGIAPGIGREANSDANHSGDRSSPGSTQSPDFGPYMDELQRRIKRAWIPPVDQETKRVVVNFKIHSDGHVSNLRIEKSSGSSRADQAALVAVENAQPFKQLPKYAPNDVDIQFTFDYNVFGGHRQ
ncbi:MAG: TonB family protein [Candidatus Obscuribacterales bacterium]|nr:TonB family protein [Candidatus Obscuribacterales bacterium]